MGAFAPAPVPSESPSASGPGALAGAELTGATGVDPIVVILMYYSL